MFIKPLLILCAFTITCAGCKIKRKSSEPAAQTVKTETEAILNLVENGRDRPDPKSIQLTNVKVDTYKLNDANDKTYSAPTILMDLGSPSPDYYTYKACNIDTKECLTGDFVEPSEILCGFSPGTYTFEDIKACNDAIPGVEASCSPAAQVNAPFTLEASTSPSLQASMKQLCDIQASMKKEVLSIAQTLTHLSVKTTDECQQNFNILLNAGPSIIAHTLFYYTGSMDTAALNAATNSTSSFAANRSNKILDLVLSVSTITLSAVLVGYSVHNLWELRTPYKSTYYELDSNGKYQVQSIKNSLTKEQFEEIDQKYDWQKTSKSINQKDDLQKTKQPEATRSQNLQRDIVITEYNQDGSKAVHKAQKYAPAKRLAAVVGILAGLSGATVGAITMNKALDLANTSTDSTTESASTNWQNQLSQDFALCFDIPEVKTHFTNIMDLLRQRDSASNGVANALK